MRLAIAALFVLIIAVGCTETKEKPLPQQTAQKFWDAMVNENIGAAKSVTIRGGIEEPLLRVDLSGVKISGARVTDGRAFVATTIYFKIPIDSFKEDECNVTMDTELLKIKRRWLVDDIVTMRNYDEALQRGVLKCTSRMLEKSLQKGLKNFESVKKELERGLLDKTKELEKSFKQIQERLRESIEKMKKEFQNSSCKLPETNRGHRI